MPKRHVSAGVIRALRAKQDKGFRALWSAEETATLQELLDGGVVSPAVIAKSGLFPRRNVGGIYNKIQALRGRQ